jgi:1,2-phenylacetyl-CoA epoxidase PaaB subunit
MLPAHRGVRAYQVFARHDKDPALRQIGEVQARTDDDAVVFAYTLYDERRWQDLFVVPQAAIIPLIRPA